MKDKEFKEFLIQNKQAVDQAMKEFEFHSKEFDKKVAKILAGL